MSTLVADTLASLDDARDQVATLGLHPYTLTVQLESYSTDLQSSATRTAIASTPVTTPSGGNYRAKRLPDEQAQWFASGNSYTDSSGRPLLVVFRVGPITPAYTGGGYSLAQLLPTPASGTTQRVVYLLTGPDLEPGGEPFELVAGSFEDPFSTYLTLRRTPLIA